MAVHPPAFTEPVLHHLLPQQEEHQEQYPECDIFGGYKESVKESLRVSRRFVRIVLARRPQMHRHQSHLARPDHFYLDAVGEGTGVAADPRARGRGLIARPVQ